MQDYLLPTVAYIAGPAEISYFAQSEVVYRQLLGRMPVILPRPGFTLVDTKAAKLLRAYKLKVEDVWEGLAGSEPENGVRCRCRRRFPGISNVIRSS